MKSKILLFSSSVAIVLCASSAPGQDFVRGDANASGRITVTDAVQVLRQVFIGPVSIPCLDAADFTDDEMLKLDDALGILLFLFASGPAPFAPFPECGPDPSGTTLDCASFPPCP